MAQRKAGALCRVACRESVTHPESGGERPRTVLPRPPQHAQFRQPLAAADISRQLEQGDEGDPLAIG